MFTSKQTLLIGAIAGGLAVAFGAFGAHALRPLLLENNAVETYNLAVQYQFYHALALLLIGLLAKTYASSSGFSWAAVSMLMGILLFSGSLYAFALTGVRFSVFVTPVGGVFFLAGWALLIATILKIKKGS
jgi:uncharacterized membrane protein YgdD (TMEM256/DUF423 family)